MDPKAAIEFLNDSTNETEERIERYCDLWSWVQKGGSTDVSETLTDETVKFLESEGFSTEADTLQKIFSYHQVRRGNRR